MTPEELTSIANLPGFGTGKTARDRMAAEAEALALLPDPKWVPIVVAAPDSNLVPMAHFGNSRDDGKDWGIYHDGRESDVWAFGDDAKTDAQIVAAIINAYRLGLIIRNDMK